MIIDKPSGLTSSGLVQQVKKMFGIKKIGHTGTLDPLATGLMILCLGQATKFSRFLIDQSKSYTVAIKLGVATDTYDSEGEVTSRGRTEHLSREGIEQALKKFRGNIQQVPPVYSAKKKNGVPSYKMARMGIQVELDPCEVSIYENTLLNFDGELLELYICCSKGTYIRAIAADLGDVLGCGAHVVSLRRNSVGHYSEIDMVDLSDLEKLRNDSELLDHLLPISAVFKDWKELILEADQAQLVKHGTKVKCLSEGMNSWVSLYEYLGGNEKRFLGIGEVSEGGVLSPRRLLN